MELCIVGDQTTRLETRGTIIVEKRVSGHENIEIGFYQIQV